ncbi:uncharacterized protein LOC114167377 isoform X2 [Vigna unguiculata]|uniref:uncharacterized protein LOC114167377 isoform X2 n=1 Tax=Vigna unguiculata TaxID=3917 RepID=UPI001016290D|nr:uncharacterized protein LOC114167377 isoform X2 [Vigna unguiculata]
MKSTFILPPTLSSNGNDGVDCSFAAFTSFIDNEISLGNAWSKFYSTTNIPNPTTVLLPSASILMLNNFDKLWRFHHSVCLHNMDLLWGCLVWQKDCINLGAYRWGASLLQILSTP